MPTVLYYKGYKFYFYSNENNEPVHIHVSKADGNAKWWLNPVEEEYSYGFTLNERKAIAKIIFENIDLFKNKWNEHFS